MKFNQDTLWIDHSAIISLQPELEAIINILMNVFGIQEKVSCFCLFAN